MLKAYENYQHRWHNDPVVASGPLFHTRTGENKRLADLVSMCCISLLAPQGALYFIVHHYKFPGSSSRQLFEIFIQPNAKFGWPQIMFNFSRNANKFAAPNFPEYNINITFTFLKLFLFVYSFWCSAVFSCPTTMFRGLYSLLFREKPH